MNRKFPLWGGLLSLSLFVAPAWSQGTPTIRLEDLDISRVSTGWGEVKRNQNVDNKPLSLGGLALAHGLGAHAPSETLIQLDGKALKLTGLVGIGDEITDRRGSIEALVLGDGKIKWKSGVMRAGEAAKKLDIDLTGVKLLELRVTDAGDGRDYDHVTWGDVQISYSGTAPVMARNPRDIWVETQNASINFRVGDDKRLYQTHFGARTSSPGQRTDMNVEALPPFGERQIWAPALRATHADGNTSTALEVVGQSTRAIDANVSLQKIELKDPSYPFFVTLNFRTYRAQDIIEMWTEIRHQENGPVTLWEFASASPVFDGRDYNLSQFHGGHTNEMNLTTEKLSFGQKTLESRLGVRTHQFNLPSFWLSREASVGEESGEVWAGSLAYSGNFAFNFEVDPDGRLRAICGMNPEDSQYPLPRNTTFQTPPMVWAWSGAGRGPLSRNFHDYARKYVLRDGNRPRATLLNNWEATFFNFDQKKLVSLFDGAKELGIELFLLDDGWFGSKYPRNDDTQGLGDWMVDKKKLPDGLSYLTAQAKQRGLRFGLWVEPEMVNPRSELFEKHPDWAIRQPKRPLDLGRNQLVLDLTRPQVKAYVQKILDDVLTQNPGISYLKWDCNRYITQPGSTYLAAGEQSKLWIDYNRALYEILEHVATKYPNVELMICSGGGGRVDYGSLRYAHEFWPSDNTDPLRRIGMQWGYSHFFPAMTLSSHVTRWGERPLKFAFDVAMSGRMGMDYDTSHLSAPDKQFAREAIAAYKSIRDVVQLGDLYRLEAPTEGARTSLVYATPDKSRAVAFAFQSQDSAASKLALRGLNATRRYLVREINLRAGITSGIAENGQVMSGEALMKGGLSLPLSKRFDSSVVEFTAQN
jgi:alpha-galactosidase